MRKQRIKFDETQIIQDRFLPEEHKMYEGIFAQGNGYIQVRGNFEEGLQDAPQNEVYVRSMKSVTTEIQRHPLSKQGTYLPLIMGHHPNLEEVIINLPFFMGVELKADEECLDLMYSEIHNYRRTLDMKTGELIRSFEWHTKSGAVIQLRFSRFASAAEQRLFVQKLECQITKGSPVMEIYSGIDASVTTNGYQHFKEIDIETGPEEVICKVKTDLEFEVLMHSWSSCTNASLSRKQKKGANSGGICYIGQLEAGTELGLVKYTAVGCSRDLCTDYQRETAEVLRKAQRCSYEELACQSRAVREPQWDMADVIIKGDEDLQHGIRFSLYHLLRCTNGTEERIQICAKGFAGEAYYGRYFWDSEMYLLPFYIYTNPQAAKSMIMYRYHTLDGARKNARRYHCSGARYPWQSGLDGTEQCSLWEYADNEIHITADVAFGVMHYYKATDDVAFMEQYGLEILLETAKFWLSRVDYDDAGNCHLLNVMGPDEYSPMTRDNGFTNRMVKYNLSSALEMLAEYRKRGDQKYFDMLVKIGLQQGDLDQMAQIAEELPVPYDAARDLYLQSADFEEYALIAFDELWLNKNKAFGHYASQEKIYRSRCIKQADTIALMNIFEDEFTEAQVAAAYDYYQPITTHDSSLSPAVHTLAANRIGRSEDVKRYINETLQVDLSVSKKGAEDGIHIANCGAVWQMVVQGFAGLRPGYLSGEITVNPRLPEHISEIQANVVWKNEIYHLVVTHSGAKLKKLQGADSI